MNWVKQIPNFLTLSNLFLGCVGIVVLNSNEIWMQEVIPQTETYRVVFLKGSFWWASVIIFIAIVLDYLDGFFARTFKAQSSLGKQLDSLADLVSFGVLPGMMMFHMMAFAFFNTREANIFPTWWHYSAFLIPVFAALRLARFNLEEKVEAGFFRGLPTPSVALFIAGLSLFFYFHEDGLRMFFLNGKNLIIPPIILLSVTLVLCWAMVSSQKIVNLKFNKSESAINKLRLQVVVITALAALVGFFVLNLQWACVPLAVVVYSLSSILLKSKTHKHAIPS